MNDSVMILLAILALVTILVIIFRKNISEFIQKWDQKRIEARPKNQLSERAIRQAHSATHSAAGAKPKAKKHHR